LCHDSASVYENDLFGQVCYIKSYMFRAARPGTLPLAVLQTLIDECVAGKVSA
jgi:hypothetical protein